MKGAGTEQNSFCLTVLISFHYRNLNSFAYKRNYSYFNYENFIFRRSFEMMIALERPLRLSGSALREQSFENTPKYLVLFLQLVSGWFLYHGFLYLECETFLEIKVFGLKLSQRDQKNGLGKQSFSNNVGFAPINVNQQSWINVNTKVDIDVEVNLDIE